jgi:hypothetical protein
MQVFFIIYFKIFLIYFKKLKYGTFLLRSYRIFKNVNRRSSTINRYYSAGHNNQPYVNEERYLFMIRYYIYNKTFFIFNCLSHKMLNDANYRYNLEGIREGINTSFYKVLDIVKYPLFTHIIVNHMGNLSEYSFI